MQKPIKNILLPVDFSKASKDAAKYALSLNKLWDAKIRIVHAIDVHPYAYYGPYPSWPEDHPPKEMQDLAKKSMDAFLRSLGMDTPTTGHNMVTTQSVAKFIGEETREFDSNLIIMATHGRTGLQDFLLGSVAKKVMRHASCPVITLTPEAMERHPEAKIKKILHPTDFSEASVQAAIYAKDLATEFNSKLEIIHVVDDVNLAYLHSHPMWEKTPVRDTIIKNVHEQLENYVDKLEHQDLVESEVHFHRGNTGEGICEVAKKTGADLIVMSTHGYSGMKRLVLGSVAERVLTTAPCPVLTMPGRKK